MFCLFSPSTCANLLRVCNGDTVPNHENKMHSSEAVPPATGPGLLLQLGRLIIRSRSGSPAPAPAAAPAPAPEHKHKPSTCHQVTSQPQKCDDERALEDQLSRHVNALWAEQMPVCIEVLLSPECGDCLKALSRPDEGSFDKRPRGLLLERWTMNTLVNKAPHSPSFMSSQWLLNAVRSQLHFSQLSAWLARLAPPPDHAQRRRKLSREQCNYKKVEANCDSTDEQTDETRKLNIVYSIKIPADNKLKEFTKPPTDHTFPFTDIGNNIFLKVVLESLPRLDDIPTVKCACPKRKPSVDVNINVPDDLIGRFNDLSVSCSYDGAIDNSKSRLNIISDEKSYIIQSVLDDRMLTPCSESGKHKCSCDDESDSKDKNTPKKLDERRIKEIAKYKRRLRKEKMRKICDSTSSEGDGLKIKETTSIPILQAARFDRLRAIGCYRNQTYLTLPTTRIETKSPFTDTELPPVEFKKTNTVGTQTDFTCQCGNLLEVTCEDCNQGMVRSTGLYNIASLQEADKNVGRRKLDDDSAVKSLKKHKCDNSSDSNINYNDSIIKRPKFKRFFPIVDKLEKIVHDRKDINKDDMKDLHLNSDDTVFSSPKEVKRHKTYSIGDDDFVFYEKCDYGTIDRNVDQNFKFADPETEDYKGQVLENTKDGFVFPYPKKGDAQVPSPSEMERFRWTFDSAASMVFHTKTGLPLTSSPAPLRRGNNCFDFDDSINGISGIKSALFHPIAPAAAAASPASPAPKLTPSRQQRNKLNLGSSTSLLGSFEESALQGRLEAVATVHGFTAELGASGAFCPPHKRLPVTVFFYAPGGTNAPYMGHINLGPHGYRVSRSGTIQVSLFNPHGTLVKMFVVLYDLTRMPPLARTFLRQRTLYMPAGAEPPSPHHMHKWLRYLIHLRFMTSKSGKLYLHTDIRLIVSRKADMDTATAHSTLFKPIPTKDEAKSEQKQEIETNSRAPNRVFGGSSEYDSERPEITGFDNSNQELTSDITEKGLHEEKNGLNREKNGYTRENGCGDQKSGFDGKLVSKSDLNGFRKEIGYDNLEGVSYELRSFTYAPENPRYSPR